MYVQNISLFLTLACFPYLMFLFILAMNQHDESKCHVTCNVKYKGYLSNEHETWNDKKATKPCGLDMTNKKIWRLMLKDKLHVAFVCNQTHLTKANICDFMHTKGVIWQWLAYKTYHDLCFLLQRKANTNTQNQQQTHKTSFLLKKDATTWQVKNKIEQVHFLKAGILIYQKPLHKNHSISALMASLWTMAGKHIHFRMFSPEKDQPKLLG